MQSIGEVLATSKIQNIILKGFDPVSAGGFTQVPNILLKSKSLSANAKVVYAQLLAYAWTNSYCFPGQERMGEDIGASQPTIHRALKELQDSGWLEVERRGQGKTNIYTLKYVVAHARVVDKSANPRAVIHG
jgi:DNA-binding transcriptional ArsR family regulator